MIYLEERNRNELREMAKQEARRQGVTFKEMVETALAAYLENQTRKRTDETFLLWRIGQE
jgi:hypothetical protein